MGGSQLVGCLRGGKLCTSEDCRCSKTDYVSELDS